MPKTLLSFFILVFSYLDVTFAADQGTPRFAAIKSNQVNARKGPGTTYPIEWVFISKGEPVKIVAEFEQWRKVEDIEHQGGWVHSSVLSPKRRVVITGSIVQKMASNPRNDARTIAKLEPGLRCELSKCKDGWCKIKCEGYKGWVEASVIWGILPQESQEM